MNMLIQVADLRVGKLHTYTGLYDLLGEHNSSGLKRVIVTHNGHSVSRLTSRDPAVLAMALIERINQGK